MKEVWTYKVNQFIRHKGLLTALIIMVAFLDANAQVNKLLNKGNESYKKQKYSEAEKSYSEALSKGPDSYNSNFNLGDALYQQKKYKESVGYFNRSAELAKTKFQKEQSYYNLGNSYLKQEEIEESITAYKNALKLDPDDLHAKYNLSYAIEKRRQKNKQQQQMSLSQSQDQKDKDKKQPSKPDNGQKPDQQIAKNQTPKEKNNISDAEAEQIMNALKNDEQKIRQRMNERQKQNEREKAGKQW